MRRKQTNEIDDLNYEMLDAYQRNQICVYAIHIPTQNTHDVITYHRIFELKNQIQEGNTIILHEVNSYKTYHSNKHQNKQFLFKFCQHCS